jgi:dTDP-4-dehydrorhamnose reductase
VPTPRPILITGATGQVGGAIAHLIPGALTPTRAELDLTSESSIRTYLRAHRPGCIINPAAYTAVDKAESEPTGAHAINAEAPRILGEEAAQLGASVLHFSTDYVFDGTSTCPYLETDPTHPTSVYGRTKLAGEQALTATGVPHLIFRTSWVFAATGKNFLLTILRVAAQRPEMSIVADQHGAPTSARDLARLTAHILSTKPDLSTHGGIYHATSAGETTWHGFATEILRLRRQADPATPYATLIPISTADYPTPAARPANSRLNCAKLSSSLGFTFPDWHKALHEVLNELQDTQRQPAVTATQNFRK